jgi:NDP-sugar pyrophosphorylase family protein
MRLLLPTLGLATLLSLPAFAGDDAEQKSSSKVRCSLTTDEGDRLVQGKNLVLKSGEEVKDAIAIDGNVVIRKGVVVHDVVAIQGRVTIEAGAHVLGDVVAVGGAVDVQEDAHVDGDAVSLGGALMVDESATVAGDRVSFSLAFGGEELVQGFLKNALGKEPRCHIEVKKD